MPSRYQIKQTVQFPEQTAVPKEQSSYALLDVIQEDILDNASYCQALIHKIFKLPYGQLPDFFSHHCKFIEDPIKWLNKLEKLIAENEDLFVTSNNRGRMMKCYTIIESKRREIKSIRSDFYNSNQHVRNKNYPLHKQHLSWTISKTALTELIYALYSKSVFNNGNADIKQIAQSFEAFFNIDLGDFYHTYLELKNRKINRTKFIDSLREGLIQKMEEEDEH